MKLSHTLLFYLIGGGVVLVDQATKIAARSLLASGGIVRVFGNDLLWFVLVFNSGSAFGIKVFPPLLLAAVALVASLAIGFYLYRNPNLKLSDGLPLALIMGGAFGNLIDRIRIGEVVDFVSVDTPDWLMERWPVFNVADSAVSIGVCAIVIFSLFNRRELPPERTEKPHPTDEPAV